MATWLSYRVPSISLNNILGVSVRVFLELTFGSMDWVKKMAFSNVDGHCPIHWSSEYNKRLCKEEFALSAWLSHRLGIRLFPVFRLGLWPKLTPSLSCFSGPQTWKGTISLSLLGLQLADYRSWNFSISIIAWVNYL